MESNKPRLLDLYCKAGGASMGYYLAGFEVVGVDKEPQPHYPFEFHQADALEYPLDGFDTYSASPPCQFGSRMTAKHCIENHVNLIPETRQRLIETGKPFVIENIPDNRTHLINPFMLCGTMFGLYLHRHRYFETIPVIYQLLHPCARIKEPVLVTGCSRRKNGRREYNRKEISDAMQIDWMLKSELDEAIPPAYTEFIGKELIKFVPKNAL